MSNRSEPIRACDDTQLFAYATANRLLAAEMFEGLTPEQWATPSLCAGWSVREVCAHLIPPASRFAAVGLIGDLVRFRGDLDRLVDVRTRRQAQRPTPELVAALRERADVRFKPPVTGAAGPMTDTAVHLRDAARPLGLDVNPTPDAWRPALDFLVSSAASKGFVPSGRLDGLLFRTTDQDWSFSRTDAGEDVVGTSEAVAMAIAGRSVALADLTGDGVPLLASRLTSV